MGKALKNILLLRDRVLKELAGKVDDFCLAGGTALSLFYFHHRESFDLDFFTKKYSEKRIQHIIDEISNATGVNVNPIKRRIVNDEAKMVVCYVPVKENMALKVDDIEKSLKLDFVEDVYRQIDPMSSVVNGIPVMSKENLYLRKIYAAFGVVKTEDKTGREKFLGGRQDAKDIFDLYYLSNTFMPLSKFMDKYCILEEKVGAVTWHKRYDRISMKSELLDIITDKELDCRAIEICFDIEIRKIVEQMTEES